MKWGVVWLVLAALGFGGGAAVLVVSRLSAQQLAMLAGAVCGALLALPLGAALGAYAWSLRRTSQAPRPDLSPVIYVATSPAPPALFEPDRPSGPPKPIGRLDVPPVSRRAFNVIGGEDLDEA